MDPEIVK